ncbi:probable polygalacturonase At1g80170 isoform X2 [Manihot esculenta]|uniref:probable polygalacturonase At1g80170 isoform X2 n=1 Tax=Manihot esculenta TaxID=3983 RepID=UPI001CC74EC7|nr:probable polygalacturonase At1g80170 isoform X2 [Manihot esculenta]
MSSSKINSLSCQGIGSGSPFLILFIHIVLCLCSCFVCVEGFDSLLQLPQSLSETSRPRSKRVFFVTDFGARGDGISNDTQAFGDAWKKACSFPARTRIVIPAGVTLLVHPVDLAGPCKSRITLNISGTVVAPKDPAYWKGLNPRKWLYFHGVNHLTIDGGGTVNGMGRRWWARSCKINPENPCRHAPTAMTFHKCKDLRVRNIRIVYGQQMHIAFTNCIRVMVFGVLVTSPAFSPNTDGIHISASRRVEVRDSIVQTGDDCISIVSNSSRIRIKNFACGPGHGISIGSLGKYHSSSKVHDILVDGAFLSNTDNGLRIKTWQTSAVKVANISYIHIKGTSATEHAIVLACSDYSPCTGLYLEDIQLVLNTEEISNSFCWEAYGSSVGLVTPPPCLSCNDSFIKQKVPSDSLQFL